MELETLADRDLVNLYELGDNKAFETLLLRYHAKVYQHIFFIVRDHELSKDIFQDTFFKAIITIRQGRYRDSGKFLAWINRIAYNLIIDYFNREKKDSVLSSDDIHSAENDLRYSEKSIEDVLYNEQVFQDVSVLLNKLPDSQQHVVRMRFFEGLSFNEIAEKTDVSVNTALGRMRYALVNMRRLASENDLYLQLR